MHTRLTPVFVALAVLLAAVSGLALVVQGVTNQNPIDIVSTLVLQANPQTVTVPPKVETRTETALPSKTVTTTSTVTPLPTVTATATETATVTLTATPELTLDEFAAQFAEVVVHTGWSLEIYPCRDHVTTRSSPPVLYDNQGNCFKPVFTGFDRSNGRFGKFLYVEQRAKIESVPVPGTTRANLWVRKIDYVLYLLPMYLDGNKYWDGYDSAVNSFQLTGLLGYFTSHAVQVSHTSGININALTVYPLSVEQYKDLSSVLKVFALEK